MSDISATMRAVQAESEARAMRHAAGQLRQFLATALCAVCGEPLGDVEIIQNDDQTKTLHATCVDKDSE